MSKETVHNRKIEWGKGIRISPRAVPEDIQEILKKNYGIDVEDCEWHYYEKVGRYTFKLSNKT